MNPTDERAWIPMSTSAEDALNRARWGAVERGETNLDPKLDFRVVQIEFTAHGFGDFHLTNVLTTQDWKHWRFHGDIYEVHSETDDILVRLTDFAEIV